MCWNWKCACLLATLLCTSTVTSAQEVEPKAPQAGEPWERLIYLPYKNLTQVFEKQQSSVILPYAEYIQLWKRSLQESRAAKPPVNGVITEASYVATVDRELARIQVVFTIQVLDKPWAEIPVSFGNAAVGKIRSADDKILLRGVGDGRYSLLVPETGTHKVELELVSRVRVSPDGQSFELTCPPVGITTFELVVPASDQTIQIQPRLVALPSDSGENETRVKASLGATPNIAASWNPRVSAKPEMDLLTSVNNTLHVSIDEGLVHKDASLKYEILRGELQEIRIAVPKDDRVLDVVAPNAKLNGWKATDEEKYKLITVTLLSPVTKTVTVEVHTERPMTKGQPLAAAGVAADQTVNGIHSMEVVRESGQLILSHAPDLVMTVDQLLGLTRINANEVAEAHRRKDAIYYKFYTSKFQVALSTKPVEPRLTVRQTAEFFFGDDQLRASSVWDFQIERAGVFGLQFQLPDDLEIDDVRVPGLSSYDANAQTKTLQIRLQEKHQGALRVEILAHRALTAEAAVATQQLPILEPRQVSREEGTIHVYAPVAIDVITDEDALTGAQSQPIAAAVRKGSTRLVAAWTYNRRPLAVAVRTERKPTRLTANVATLVRVKPELVRIQTELDYVVEHAGIDTFQFSVPEAISDSIQIETGESGNGISIKQKRRDEDAVDGWVTWTVIMQRDILGQQRFVVTYDLPTQGAAEGTDVESVLQPLQASGLTDFRGSAISLARITGEIVVLKDKSLSVSAVPDGDDIELIDIREVRSAIAAAPERGMILSLAYRYFKQPVELQLTTSKHEIKEVVETVIPRALVEVVIGRDRIATYRCRYKVVSSERQRLKMELPVDVEVLERRLDSNKVALEKSDADVEKGWEAYYINVARSKSADEPFFITLLFRAPVVASNERPFQGRLGSQKLRFPRIGDEDNYVAMQQTRFMVWIPEDFAFIGTPEGFTLDAQSVVTRLMNDDRMFVPSEDRLDEWIGDVAVTTADFPTEGHAYVFNNLGGSAAVDVTWWRKSFSMWVLSGSIFAIGWILRKTSWENRLTVTLLLVFLAALYALRSPDIVVQALLASRLGILATLVCWMIHGLWSVSHTAAPRVPIRHATKAPAVIPPPGVFEMEQALLSRHRDRG